MEENKYWITIWKLVAGTICVIIVSIGGCQSYQNKQIASLIATGIDPIKAACSISPQQMSREICAAVATKQ